MTQNSRLDRTAISSGRWYRLAPCFHKKDGAARSNSADAQEIGNGFVSSSSSFSASPWRALNGSKIKSEGHRGPWPGVLGCFVLALMRWVSLGLGAGRGAFGGIA